MKMQEQIGNDACGVFAIAVATALCYEEAQYHGVEAKFNVMWQHILECFKANKMASLPIWQLKMRHQNQEHVNTQTIL